MPLFSHMQKAGFLMMLLISSSGTVFDFIPKEDKKRMEEAKQIKTETKPSDGTQDSVTKQPSLASISEEQEMRQPVISSQEPVHSPANKEPVWSQSSQEPGLASEEEQRRTSIPLFQGGAGFKPFIRDPEKQERYEKYLALVKQGHRGKN